MPEFTLTTNKTEDTEIIHLFTTNELRKRFIEKQKNTIDNKSEIKDTLKVGKENKVSGGLDHLIF